MGLDLQGARILLTGASSGIGAALAPMLAQRGATLALVARRRPELEAVLEECQEDAPDSRMWLHDLDDVEGSVALAAEIWAEAGPLDAVIHNAAMPKRRHVAKVSVDDLDQTMRVNFFSPVRMTMALLPRMLERGRGQFVFVSSFGGRAGIPAETAYCASKFALCGWAEAMQIDLWDSPLEFRLVIPGPVDTDIWERPGSDQAHYDGPLTPPAEVAEGIVALMEGDTFEAYLPDLKAVAEFKTSDPDAYLAGAADMARQAEANPG